MTPVGMDNRDAFTPEKPSPAIIRAPNVVSPSNPISYLMYNIDVMAAHLR